MLGPLSVRYSFASFRPLIRLNSRFLSSTGKARLINESIQSERILLVNEHGQKQGITPLRDQLSQLDRNRFQLVQVGMSNEATDGIPICRIMPLVDKTEPSHHLSTPVKSKPEKQIRMNAKIGDHDLMIWLRKAQDFLRKGSTVRIAVQIDRKSNKKFSLHGTSSAKELQPAEVQLLMRVKQLMTEATNEEFNACAQVSFGPQKEGDSYVMVLRPRSK